VEERTSRRGDEDPEQPRTLSIPSFLCEILGAHLGHAPDAEFVLVGRDEAAAPKQLGRRHWKVTVMAPGLPERLRFDDLRHTCASILIAQGAHPEVQARLGHASIMVTMDRYEHLLPSLGAQLDDNLERVRLVRRSA